MKAQRKSDSKLVHYRLRAHEREQVERLARLLGCTKTDAVRRAVQAELERVEASQVLPQEVSYDPLQ